MQHLFDKHLFERVANIHSEKYNGSMSHLADFLLTDHSIQDLVIACANGGITDAKFHEILVSLFRLNIFDNARKCGFPNEMFMQERLSTVLRSRMMMIVNSDPTMGEISFLMCHTGCCLVVHPQHKDTCKEVSLVKIRKQPTSFSADSVGLHGWECPYCKGSTLTMFKYATIAQWMRNMYADTEQREHLQWYVDNFDDLTTEKIDRVSDILDSRVVQELKGKLARRGAQLCKWDIIFGINLDGAELLKYLSAWPLLVKCFCFPPKVRYVYTYILCVFQLSYI
jgi:hypothetical protein